MLSHIQAGKTRGGTDEGGPLGIKSWGEPPDI